MKRSVFAAMLAITAALVPGTGQAHSGLTAGVCQIGGQVNYSNPVVTIPDPTSYTVQGTLICIENARASASGAGLFGFTGFFQGSGVGQVGCSLSENFTGTGTFTLTTVAVGNTRDVWTGTFNNIGGVVSLLTASITNIKHETLVGTTWTPTATEIPTASAALGEFVFQVDDPTACSGAGFSVRDFIGNLAYTYLLP
jgi:hypothetical protein